MEIFSFLSEVLGNKNGHVRTYLYRSIDFNLLCNTIRMKNCTPMERLKWCVLCVCVCVYIRTRFNRTYIM